MATSASNSKSSGYNNHYHTYMTITVNSQDKTNNKSNVTVKMYAKSDSTTYKYAGSSTVKLAVDGSQKVNKNMSVNFANKAKVSLASWTGDIAHNSEGKKSFSCSGSWTASSDWVSGGSISCSITLDDIPRATKPTLSVSSVELGKVLTIGIAPAVSGWKHNLYYRFGSGAWTQFVTDRTGNYSWTVPMNLANSITSAVSATLTIGMNTYNGSGTRIGSTQTVNVKVTVPSSVKPSISSVTVSEAVSELASEYGVYIQGKSKLRIVTAASGAYKSTISAYKHTIAGTAYTAKADYTSGVIGASGDIQIVTTVTDTRGRTASKTTTVHVYAYTAPKITKFTCTRCGEGGTIDNNGTFVKVTMAFAVSSVNDKNAKAYTLAYKVSSDTEYMELLSGSVYSYADTYVTEGIFLAANSYDIRLTVTDSFTTSTASAKVNTASRLMSYIVKKTALAVGKVAELASTFDVALEAVFRKSVQMYDKLSVVGEISEGGVPLKSKYVIRQDPVLLWSGTLWPNGSQNATLSKKVSAQNFGIVLVFSRYVSGEGAKDERFHCFFIPKTLVAAMPGKGHTFILSTTNFLGNAAKYCYIYDDRITGHDNNATSGTNNGIVYDNTIFCLRYVYGI